MRLRGFTLTELIVVIFALLMGVAFALAAVGRLDDRDSRIKCASNLREIGQAILLYSNDSRGYFPRTRYDPDQADRPTAYSGVNGPDPFQKGGPDANDVSAAIFLLLRTEDITSAVFICPASGARRDDYGGGIHTALEKSNFPSAEFLSYSYADPYPTKQAAGRGYNLFQNDVAPDFAVAADMNPGSDALTKLTTNLSAAELRKGNSLNHSGDGQNVLYGDGHVEFQNSPLCGAHRDNIYTFGDSGNDPVTGAARPTGGEGILGSPVSRDDSVLLPALNVNMTGPVEAPPAAAAASPMPPTFDQGTDFLGWALWLLGACILAAIGLAVFGAMQKRRNSGASGPG
jgi:prepilin-type N-terminal cleavage/methylation domain-containing protein/prepilin-type processing-associated H-X9-DG protein